MLFDLYYRNYATEGDVDLNEQVHDVAPNDQVHGVDLNDQVHGKEPGALESLARQRLARKMQDAGKARKTHKRKDGLSF